jgi:hypothetical protein
VTGRSPSGRATHERSQSTLSPPPVGDPNADLAGALAQIHIVASEEHADLQTCRDLLAAVSRYAGKASGLVRVDEALAETSADDDLEAPPATLDEYLDGLTPLDDETGWLIEENAGGVIQWIALRDNVWQRGWYISETAQPSPVRRVKDSNDALRFSRWRDANAFVSLFKRFLLAPNVTEHCWPAIATEAHRAETVQLGSVHEGAGRNGIAQGPSQ